MTVPHDPHAELQVVGHTTASPAGYLAAITHCTPDDFYNPRHAQIFAAAELAPDRPLDLRIDTIAHTAGVNRTHLERAVNERLFMWDLTGRFSRRVAALADRRRRLAELDTERLTLMEDR